MDSPELTKLHKKILVRINEVVTTFAESDKASKNIIAKQAEQISDLMTKLTALTIAFHEHLKLHVPR